jgi:hypothetical protein
MYGRLAVLQSTLLLKDPVMQLTRLQLPMIAEWLKQCPSPIGVSRPKED